MNDADVSKQMQQMVRFIRLEAQEKANEISISAEEEFNIAKLQIVEAEKRKVMQEYDRKAKQLNASRIKVLQAQDDVVNAMKDSASEELLSVADDKNAYKKLLKGLIVQSLLRLKEPSVLLRCREIDVELIESILEEAKEQYAEKANDCAPMITLDNRVYLLPPPSSEESNGPSCAGGVILASQDGKIVCDNTLDARLDVVFRQKLPEIRKLLLRKASS